MGREALATIGYLQLIHFAREAGWVTVKEGRRTSTSSRALLSMDAVQAEAMREFTEVFSKYAVIAGVTSQSDTPLPGPMDLAAIGVLVFGLIAAGYVAVSVLDAVGNAPPPCC